MKRIIVDEETIRRVCSSSKSMAEAAHSCGIHFNTFKRYAMKLGCYSPNQSGLGISKNKPEKYSVEEILSGDVPHFQTFKLKRKLLQNQILEKKCAICGITSWNGREINLELDHIDGKRSNHKLENLRLLCPNCHSQTDTYRAKNIKKKI